MNKSGNLGYVTQPTLMVENMAGTECGESRDFNRVISVLKVAGIKCK